MEVGPIVELAETMQRLGLTRVRWRQGEQELELEMAGRPRPTGLELQEVIQGILPPVEGGPSKPLLTVKSPLVGTFYTRPSPQHSPFVEPGQRISPDTIVGIVEAMKVMNEIRAGVEGVVIRVEKQDGDPVEFGSPLLSYSAETPCTKS